MLPALRDLMSEKEEIILRGVAAAPGVAHGPVFIFRQKDLEIPAYKIAEENLPEEIERFEQALLQTRQQIIGIRNQIASKLGEDEAQIFDAHLLVLEDKALIEETIRETEKSRYNIDHVFQSVSSRYIEAFLKIDDEYIQERVADIRDVSKRLLHNLMGRTPNIIGRFAAARVIVSEDLAPSDAAAFEKDKVLGLVTDLGGRTSHAVIMARSLDVPAVVGLHDISQKVDIGDTVLVDGFSGRVVVNPSEDTLFQYGKLKHRQETIREIFRQASQEPSVTRDGRHITLSANIEGVEDVEDVQRVGAEGVGLYRTEILFLRENDFPGEEEQYRAYREVVERVAPHPVIIRTLDLGGDKTVHDYFEEHENNPFMGFRAIRFCLEHPTIFRQQLRAILRASAHGKVKIMYPMISGLAELLQANEHLEACRQELSGRGTAFDPEMPVGSMIEIPSAAYIADHLAEHCDFFSVGTNDLIQYLLAVDRINDRIAHLYEPSHPAILRTLRHIFEVGRQNDIEVGVCGEMAGDPLYAALLLGMGATRLSASPAAIPELKFLCRNMELRRAQDLAESVLSLRDTADITGELKSFYDEHVTAALQASM